MPYRKYAQMLALACLVISSVSAQETFPVATNANDKGKSTASLEQRKTCPHPGPKGGCAHKPRCLFPAPAR